ncbi:hypothetical protein KIN20_019809 [Parelaphostrongylus tenuis]|uniref:Uncharacterized protein n=1 Tax=Parelaphostrongylus tenuis TaxID=148309 RepID=A0AAD5N3H4_PARTN|nr:hypothetical protein KIN20_019809 [Parelaphostrongylus tenuis]
MPPKMITNILTCDHLMPQEFRQVQLQETARVQIVVREQKSKGFERCFLSSKSFLVALKEQE